MSNNNVTVSVIIPVFNGAAYLEECLESIKSQERHDVTLTQKTEDPDEISVAIEVSVYDDASTDDTPTILVEWATIFKNIPGFSVVFSRNMTGKPRGVGFAKNRAVEQSTGDYLCFCDADDIMEPSRIMKQFEAAVGRHDALIGSKFSRLPPDSTRSLTRWANSLSETQLYTQLYQSFGPTLVMPTWFCHRNVFDRVNGGFSEMGQGVPEDLIFFYQHIDAGGSLYRVDKELMVYRYHPAATTFSVNESTIWDVRFRQFERNILSQSSWSHFTIWGAGKLGRRFFRSLLADNRRRVAQFCDIDERKLKQRFYEPHPNPENLRVPIVPVDESRPPYVVCIKIEYSWDAKSPFRKHAEHHGLTEGKDYYFFS